MMSLAPGTRHDLTTQHVGLAASPFGRLPTEILALIASQLDDDNYLRLSYVSRAVWQLAHDPTLLRRRVASPASCTVRAWERSDTEPLWELFVIQTKIRLLRKDSTPSDIKLPGTVSPAYHGESLPSLGESGRYVAFVLEGGGWCLWNVYSRSYVTFSQLRGRTVHHPEQKYLFIELVDEHDLLVLRKDTRNGENSWQIWHLNDLSRPIYEGERELPFANDHKHLLLRKYSRQQLVVYDVDLLKRRKPAVVETFEDVWHFASASLSSTLLLIGSPAENLSTSPSPRRVMTRPSAERSLQIAPRTVQHWDLDTGNLVQSKSFSHFHVAAGKGLANLNLSNDGQLAGLSRRPNIAQIWSLSDPAWALTSVPVIADPEDDGEWWHTYPAPSSDGRYLTTHHERRRGRELMALYELHAPFRMWIVRLAWRELVVRPPTGQERLFQQLLLHLRMRLNAAFTDTRHSELDNLQGADAMTAARRAYIQHLGFSVPANANLCCIAYLWSPSHFPDAAPIDMPDNDLDLHISPHYFSRLHISDVAPNGEWMMACHEGQPTFLLPSYGSSELYGKLRCDAPGCNTSVSADYSNSSSDSD
jgi:hypothetical protein